MPIEIHDDPSDPNYVRLNREDAQALQQSVERDAERDARTERLARENIALRAGVNLDHPRANFLLSGWPVEAEFTPEAVRAAAEDLGLLAGGTPAATGDAPVITPEEQRQTEVRQQLQPNSTPAGAEPEIHPSVDAMNEFHRALDRGMNNETAMAAGINRIVQRVANGTGKQLIIRGGENDGEPIADIVARKGFLQVSEIMPPRITAVSR